MKRGRVQKVSPGGWSAVKRGILLGAAFLQACDAGAEPPPHPPPHPTLDIVVEDTMVHINGRTLDAERVTEGEVAAAFEGLAPNSTSQDLRKLGVFVGIEGGRMKSLKLLFTPYGLAEDRGAGAFAGRLIVNGAWIHPDATLYHIDEELGYPCRRSTKGNGVFTESAFANSWTCEVGDKPYLYWLKRYPEAEHPLFAFEIEFHEAPYPPQEPLPEVSGWDVLTLPWHLLKAVVGFVQDIVDTDSAADQPLTPQHLTPAE